MLAGVNIMVKGFASELVRDLASEWGFSFVGKAILAR